MIRLNDDLAQISTWLALQKYCTELSNAKVQCNYNAPE